MHWAASGTAYDGAHELGPAGARAPAREPGRRLPPDPPHRRGSASPGSAGPGPLFFTLVGGFMRFWHVGAPHQLIFDETYYVKQGWSMVLYWFEMKNDAVLQQANQVDQHFTANDPFVYGTEGDFVVHPPVGKWLIGLGRDAVRHPQLLRLALRRRPGRHASRSSCSGGSRGGSSAPTCSARSPPHCSPSRGTTSSTRAPGCSTSSSCSSGSPRSGRCSSTATRRARCSRRKVGRARPRGVDPGSGRGSAGGRGAGSPASCSVSRPARSGRASTSSSSSACSPCCGTSGRDGPPACAAGRSAGVVKDGLYRVRAARRRPPSSPTSRAGPGWILTQGRLVPHVGRRHGPDAAHGLAARLVALALGLPPADVRLDAVDQRARTPTRRARGRG